MHIEYKMPTGNEQSNVDSVTLEEQLSVYALNVIFDLLDRQAKLLFCLAHEVENEVTEPDDILEQAVLKFVNNKVIKDKVLAANAIKIAEAESKDAKAEETAINRTRQVLYTNIKSQYVEFPGVDLLTIRDDYVIGIDDDTVCLYNTIEDFSTCTPLESFSLPHNLPDGKR